MGRICAVIAWALQVVGAVAADPTPRFPVLGNWESKESVRWKFEEPTKLPIWFMEGGKFRVAVGGGPEAYLLEEGTYQFLDTTTIEAKFTFEKKATALQFSLEDGKLTTIGVTGKPLEFRKKESVKSPVPKDEKPQQKPDTTKAGEDRPPRVVPTSRPLLRKDPRPLPDGASKDHAVVSESRPEEDRPKSSAPPPDSGYNGLAIAAIIGVGVLLLASWLALRRRP